MVGSAKAAWTSSRIDLVLANPVAQAAVRGLRHRFDLATSDHVPIKLTLALAAFAEWVTRLVKPVPLPVARDTDVDPAVREAALADVFARFHPSLLDALAQGETKCAHRLWCDLAHQHLLYLNGGPPLDQRAGAAARGRPPRFRRVWRALRADGPLFGLSTAEARHRDELRRQLREVAWRIPRVPWPL